MSMNTVRNVKETKSENSELLRLGGQKYGYIYCYIPIYIHTFHESLGGIFLNLLSNRLAFSSFIFLHGKKFTIYVFQCLHHSQSLICFLVVIPFQTFKFYILLIRSYVISKNFQSSSHYGIKVMQCKYCFIGNSLGNLCDQILLQFSHYCETTWTIYCQALLPIGYARQEYWNGVAISFPAQGLNPSLLWLLHRQVGSLPLNHQGSSSQKNRTYS